MNTEHVTVSDVAATREARVKHIQELQSTFGKPVAAFKMNIPGPVKNHPLYTRAMISGVHAFKQQLDASGIKILEAIRLDQKTGIEVYLVCDTDLDTLKGHGIALEDEHPLGRLMDVDVYGVNGWSLSRSDLGHEDRKCFLCGDLAHSCGRSRKHDLEILIHHVHQTIELYFGGALDDKNLGKDSIEYRV